MRKPMIIDLSKYRLSTATDRVDLVIQTMANGVLRELNYTYNQELSFITDTEGVEWSEFSRLSTEGTDEEYAKRVDWWANNMSEEFMNELKAITMFAANEGWNLEMSLAKFWQKMKSAPVSSRKSFLRKHVVNWVIKGSTYWSQAHINIPKL